MGKRIVINVEPGISKAPARRKSSRWLRILVVLAIFVAALLGVIVLSGFFWWRHYQTTPAYSLALLLDAAQRGNEEELAKRIDYEEVARNMVGAVSKKANARYGLAMSSETQQKIDQAMPSLMPRMKQTIHDEVAKEIKSFVTVSAPNPKPFYVLLFGVPWLLTITTEGDVAKAVTATTNSSFELTMRRDADRWKVTSFNADVVVQRVVDSVMKDLPAIGAFDSGDSLFKNPRRSRKKRK